MGETQDLTLEEFIVPQIALLEKFRLLWSKGIMDNGWPKRFSEAAWKRQLSAASRTLPSYEKQHGQERHCDHPPERLYSWFAFNHETGESDIQCVGCCDCGLILKG